MKVQENPIRDILRLVMWYPVRWLIAVLPVILGIKLLRSVGDVHYYCSRGKKQHLKNTIASFAPASLDIDFAVRAYFRNHYIDQLFILIFPKMKMADIDKLVEIKGLQHLQQCRKRKKGVVLVHGHFGPAHLPLVALALLGFPMKQIGNPSDAGLSWIGKNVAYRLRMQYEGMMPAEIIEVNKFLRPIFRALRHNEVVMTTGDGSGTDNEFGQQHKKEFLGKIRRLPLGPAILAGKTGAALLPLFVVPGQKKMFEVIIGEEIQVQPEIENGCVVSMQDFLEQYEKHVLCCPGYMHFLDRLEV